jgi:hypothetical protein
MTDNGEETLPLGPPERKPVPDPTLLTTSTIRREIALLRDKHDDDMADFRALLEEKFIFIQRQFDDVNDTRKELKEDRIREIAAQQAAQDAALELNRVLSDERLEGVRVELSQHRLLSDTKFGNLQTELDLIERQRAEQKRDAEKGVETARQSADKALTDFMVRYERAHDELFQRTETSLQLFRAAVEEKFMSAEKLVNQQASASERAVAKAESATGEQLRLLTQPIDDLKARVGAIEAKQLGAAEKRDDSRGSIGVWVGIAGVFLTIVTIVAMVLMNTAHVVGH